MSAVAGSHAHLYPFCPPLSPARLDTLSEEEVTSLLCLRYRAFLRSGCNQTQALLRAVGYHAEERARALRS